VPKLNLTQTEIKKIVAPESGRVDYFDTELKGFLLRVSADYPDKKTGVIQKGARVFYVQVDVLDSLTGKFTTRKAKIGQYGEYTPEQARKKAPDIMQRLRDGKPAVEERPPTLRKLYHQYVNDKKLKSNTATAYKIYFENEGGAKFSKWMDVPINDLMLMLIPDVVIRRYQEVLNNSGKGAASNAFKMLQAIINYGMLLYPQYIRLNPVKVISAAELWPEIKARTTCIEPEQFKIFHDALLSFPAIHRDCYLFTLYQGLRPDEAHSLRWEDVHLEKKLFDLTWKDSETKHRGILPLSRQSVEILKRRESVMQKTDVYVFPSSAKKSKNGHITLRADKLRPKSGLDITPHSLRRSFTTVGERLRLRREDINLLTNHIDQTVTGKHYSRIGVEDLRAPLQLICNEIERLMVEGVGGKVIYLATAYK
jgi:integrase